MPKWLDPHNNPSKPKYVFTAKPDDLIIEFRYPHGVITLNQRWIETGPKAKVTVLMKCIDRAMR